MGSASHLPSKGPVYAFHALQAASELSMLDALASLRAPDPTLLPTLHALLAARPPPDAPQAPLAAAPARAIAAFTLNSSQQAAVARAVQALQGTSRGVSRVRLAERRAHSDSTWHFWQ